MGLFSKIISRDIISYLPSKILPAFTQFLFLAALTRLLATGQYGRYTAVMAGVSLTMVFGLSWLRQSVLRYYNTSAEIGELRAIVSTAINSFFLIITFSFIMASLSVVFYPGLRDGLFPYIVVGTAVILVRGVLMIAQTVRRMQLKSTRYTIIVCSDAAFQVIAAIALIVVLERGAISALLGLVTATGAVALVEVVRFYRDGVYRITALSVERLKKMFEYGVPYIGSVLAGRVLELADNFLILGILGSMALGTYASGYKLYYRTGFLLFSLITLAAYPQIVNIYEDDGAEQASEGITDTFRIFLLIAVPGTFGVIAIAPELTNLALDKSYSGTVVIAPWIIFGTLLYGASQIALYPVQLVERTRWALIVSVIAATINLAANFALIPRYGIVGAAIATFAAYGTLFFTAHRVGQRMLKWKFPTMLCLKVTFASVLMWSVVKTLSRFVDGIWFLGFGIPVGIVVYVVVMLPLEIPEMVEARVQLLKHVPLTRKSKD